MDRTLWWKDSGGDWIEVKRYMPGRNVPYLCDGGLWRDLDYFRDRKYTKTPPMRDAND